MNEKRKVLVVDDEKNMRITLADILTDEGYQVDTAEDGHMAVTMCQNTEYDVVLMDVRMPGINGVEAFRQIRQSQQGLRVILMSAFSLEGLKQEALEEGAIGFLSKPLEIESVIGLIEEQKETSILVIEADDKIATPIHNTLKDKGFWVQVCHTPHEALSLVEQINFDIIFIDVELAEMNGLDTYLAIKKITPSSISIMISGKEEEFVKLAREAVQQTAYTIIKKPLNLDHLLSLLSRIQKQRVSDDIQKPSLNE